MNQEKLKEALEAIGRANIHIAGDFVLEKHVGTEIANVNVEAGGTVNVAGGVEGADAISKSPVQDNENKQENSEELFHFIHPSVEREDEWHIHNEVKRLVSRNGIQEICAYLREKKKDKKVLLPQSPSIAYTELVRMGMPTGEGFNDKTFYKYYLK